MEAEGRLRNDRSDPAGTDILGCPARPQAWAAQLYLRRDLFLGYCSKASNCAEKLSAEDIPVVAFSVGEEELSGLDAKPLVGQLAAWNYFESINTPANKAFITDWHAFIKNPKRTANDPMEATCICFNLWVKAVTKAGSTDVEKVLAALPGTETPNLTGGIVKVLPNHHITKPVYIGEVKADGQFNVVWKSDGTVPGDAWSDFLPGSKDIEADWVTLKCGNYNKVTKKCSGQNYK